jgi:hypothetical protein
MFFYNYKEKIKIDNYKEKIKMINKLNELIKEKTFNVDNYLMDNYENIELIIENENENELFIYFKI